ncbi:hypothetical protein E6C76_05655 [Pseudothauera nasutitermitis]|uniref:Oxidoreductase molybdopterin-binding domain-containing protein n=1 Tax=Pseudothauera nasutitermitis TaxID=2565930 RepID=A0A4V3WCA5_9RHOO|nr:molybdopterin-dependent oxidoreductase [Pseudothauera nasutitermitis]THF66328.1 hypothetical protein E6C76_05655 [Pseudothauera nasutitermitis]
MKRLRHALAAFAALFLFVSAVRAAPAGAPYPVTLPAFPAGPQVLSTVAPDGATQRYSMADLEALGTWELTTSTFWPGDDGTYQGVLLSALLRDAGLAEAAAVRLVAQDGFSQVIPRADWVTWPVLLASRRDGGAMARRDKGPLRIIYPREMDGALHDAVYRLRWIWMLARIEAVAE